MQIGLVGLDNGDLWVLSSQPNKKQSRLGKSAMRRFSTDPDESGDYPPTRQQGMGNEVPSMICRSVRRMLWLMRRP
jgi:hypothetical protein